MIRFLLSLYFGTCIFSLCTLVGLIIDVMKDLHQEDFDFDSDKYNEDNNSSPIRTICLTIFLIFCPIINIGWSFIVLSNYNDIRGNLLNEFYTYRK